MKGYIEERKWGRFEIIDEGPDFLVKRMTLLPGKGTSLQYHHHRDEHWTIVKGTATIVHGSRNLELHENESIHIRKTEVHKVDNNTDSEMIFIEVWHGSLLSEDDIVRLNAQ